MPGKISASVKIVLPNTYYGLDANKPASPSVGDLYVATDVDKFYICFVAGAWSAPFIYIPDGTDTGDIIRWNAVTGHWESCAEPFEFDHIIFIPTDTPPTPIQGGMYFNLSENAVYVGVT